VVKTAFYLAVALTVAASIAHAAPTPRYQHVPPAEAESGTALELIVGAPPAAPALVAHHRLAGTINWQTVELVRRDDNHWVAVIPALAVVAPGVEYYVEAGGAPVFASAAAPHVVRVEVTEAARRKLRDDLRTQNRHSRVHTSGEWVDYGRRVVGGMALSDSYYRVEGDFSYRLLAYPLETLRAGFTRMIGTTQTMDCPVGSPPPCTVETGFGVGGWFELGLAPVEGVGLDLRPVVMATKQGFAVGGRAELRIGMRDATHVATGAEFAADVGTSGFFRLGWGTIRRVPMAATLEVTNMPLSTSDIGVRLYYDVAGQLADNVRIGIRVGYAAREQSVLGFMGGANATVDF
jgi:hypothetical protein